MTAREIIFMVAAAAGAAGYFAGFAHADFLVTWRQRRHVSIDAVFLSGMAAMIAMVGGAIFWRFGNVG